MKKIGCFLLAVLLAVCLAACGSPEVSSSDVGNLSALQNSSQETAEDAARSESDPLVSEDNASPSTESGTSTLEASSAASAEPEPVTQGTSSAAPAGSPVEQKPSNSTETGTVTQGTSSAAPAGPSVEQKPSSSAETGTATQGTSSAAPAGPSVKEESAKEESEEESIMQQNTFSVTVGGKTFSAVFAENAGAQALKELLAGGDLTISMSDYAGFEKVGSLGRSLPTENSQTTTQAGDIVLYQGNQIVIFYGSNSWSYTRLGKIENLTGWQEALGSGDVTVTFSLKGT